MNSQKIGANFEKFITKTIRVLNQKEVCLVRKVQIPLTITKKGLVIGISTVDYEGCTMNGTYVAIEAKSTKIKTRFDFSLIKPHQLDYLHRVAMMNGFAYLLIEGIGKVFLVPENIIYEQVRKGLKSMKWSGLMEYAMDYGDLQDKLEEAFRKF